MSKRLRTILDIAACILLVPVLLLAVILIVPPLLELMEWSMDLWR